MRANGSFVREATERDREALRKLYWHLAQSEYKLDFPYRELLVPPEERFRKLVGRLDGLGGTEYTWLVVVEGETIASLEAKPPASADTMIRRDLTMDIVNSSAVSKVCSGGR